MVYVHPEQEQLHSLPHHHAEKSWYNKVLSRHETVTTIKCLSCQMYFMQVVRVPQPVWWKMSEKKAWRKPLQGAASVSGYGGKELQLLSLPIKAIAIFITKMSSRTGGQE